jgi:hypothetical protein
MRELQRFFFLYWCLFLPIISSSLKHFLVPHQLFNRNTVPTLKLEERVGRKEGGGDLGARQDQIVTFSLVFSCSIVLSTP